MILQTMILGELDANCYLLSGREGHAVVIDPAGQAERIAARLTEQGMALDAIFLTHAHFDHMGGLQRLHAMTGAPVYVHPAEEAIVPTMSRGRMPQEHLPYEDTMTAAGLTFRVLHTPGHSPGSVCLQTEDALFTGDTLFAGCCGRTDLPGGSWEDMARSLRQLLSMEGSYTVYPGHGDPSTLEIEKKANPYLRES